MNVKYKKISPFKSSKVQTFNVPDLTLNLERLNSARRARLNCAAILFFFAVLCAAPAHAQLIRAEQIAKDASAFTSTAGQLALAQPIVTGSQRRCADAGSTDAYACAPTIAPTAYLTGMSIDLWPNTINTGPATVNVSSLGAKTIVQHDGSALTDGLLQAGRNYWLTYDGTNFKMQAGGTGSGTVTGSCATANAIAKFTSSTVLACSSIVDDGTGTYKFGDVSGNTHDIDFATPTGAHVHTFPAATGDVAQTTGSLTNGNYAKFDSSGRIVDGGGSVGGGVLTTGDAGGNMACGTTTYFSLATWQLDGTESNTEMRAPLAGTVRNLYVDSTAIPASQTVVWTLRKAGAGTALTCTQTATQTQCADTSNTVAFAQGDKISLEGVCSGGSTAIDKVRVSMVLQ